MPNEFSLDYHSSAETGNNGVVAVGSSIKKERVDLILWIRSNERYCRSECAK